MHLNLDSYNGPMVCDTCHEEKEFLLGVSQDAFQRPDVFYCKECFQKEEPDYATEVIADFEELLQLIEEEKAKNMTLDEMYELYGDEDEHEREGEHSGAEDSSETD